MSDFEERDEGLPDDLAELGEEEVLEQLQELHRQLAERQKDEDEPKRDATLAPPKKLIICATRRPVRLEKPFGEAAFRYEASRSGLTSAVKALQADGVECRWVAWPGCAVDKTSQEGVRQRLEDEYNCRPVFLERDLVVSFYERFCHGVLWPLFHSLHADVTGRTDLYEAYVQANQRYLDAVALEYQEGDVVLVHDYELMLLPAMIRARFPDAPVGFFCHCPFPSSEFYRMLPARESLLRGALGADLVSFNHFDYVRHFLNACMRVLGLESAPSRLEYLGRLVSVSICPAGIDPKRFLEDHDDLAERVKRLTAHGQRVILSLDALDASKGIPQRLLALEALLDRRPEWCGKAVLVLAARDRGRRVDAPLRRAVDALVGHVNGRFGRADYVPVHYIKRRLGDDEVKALYVAADVALIASVREGINLWAMEYVACQEINESPPGVLVYSEFAGCASSFSGGALIVNPYDAEGVADALHNALSMKVTERRLRHHALERYVNTYTASLWGRRLVRELRLARERTSTHDTLLPLDVAQLRSFYERSRRRLLVLEYDGALAPHASLPRLAQPSPPLVSALRALCADTRNTVYVFSGRRRDDLDEWLGRAELPRLGLVAEGGYWVRRAPPPLLTVASGTSLATSLDEVEVSPEKLNEEDPGDWAPPERAVDLTWRDEVTPILESFTRRTPGSALEATSSRLCWYFRDADPDFGESQAKNLQLHLEVVVEHRPVRVVMSSEKKSIVVQPARVSPGRALRGCIPDIDAYDLILAVGDERYTEEDVFELFEGSPHSFSVTVGRRLSRAAFFLDEEEVLPTLQTLAAVSTDPLGTPTSLPRVNSGSMDLGAARMPESPLPLAASFRPIEQSQFPSFEEVFTVEGPDAASAAAAALVQNHTLNLQFLVTD